MSLTSFGYFTFQSARLDDWADFGPKFLGLQLVERTQGTLKFRMDDRSQRILVREGMQDDDRATFGWEVPDVAALDALAGRLEAAKVAVERLPRPECAMRGIGDGVRFADPTGNRLEAFVDPELSSEPFRPGRTISGFRTGALGMGHAVLNVESIDDLLWFYQDVLGFRLSDFALKPIKPFFFHINPRHHSLALIESGRRGVHHIMMELKQLDDVGQGYDLAQADPDTIAVTLGRHTNDFMTSFYSRTPGSFMIEYGWGGRTIDPQGWQASEMTYGPSLWGHERTWLPPHDLIALRAIRARAAADGVSQPVQVAEGNYQTGSSGCAWWERQKQG